MILPLLSQVDWVHLDSWRGVMDVRTYDALEISVLSSVDFDFPDGVLEEEVDVS